MAKKKVDKKEFKAWAKCCKIGSHHSHGGSMYGLGFIGAVVYYMTTATSFGMGFVGVLKAFVWPAFLIFELFKFLGM